MNNQRNVFGLIFLISLISLLLLPSCGKKENTVYSDEYHSGTDWQYFQTTAWGRHPRIQETETGAVLYHDRFIYLYDRKSGSIMPLCSKANCLHENETDPEKRKECSAFLDNCQGDDRSTSLMLYKDVLYVCYTRSEAGSPECVYRISLDGQSKDEILRATNIEMPLVHRGYLYYFTMEFTATIGEAYEGIDSHWQFCRMNIEEQNPKEEILLKPDENSGVSTIFAFGNHIYFQLAYLGRETTSPFMCYDIRTGKMEETTIGFDGHMIYQGHMYLLPFDESKPYDADSAVYRADPMGKREELVLNDIPQGMYLTSDDHYLYNYSGSLNETNPEEEKFFRVSDINMDLVDKSIGPEELGDQRDFLVGEKR